MKQTKTKFWALAMALIICLLLLAQIIIFVDFSKIAPPISSSDIAKIKDLGNIQEFEKDNIDLMFNTNAKNDMLPQTFSESEAVAKRYLAVKDFDETEKYLYAEYEGGGYAVYDRLGQYLYEKNPYGSGPFAAYTDESILYYGGPSYFYVKQNNEFEHTIIDEVVDKEQAQHMSAGLNEIRNDYATGENTAMSLQSLKTRAAEPEMFSLGQNIPTDSIYLSDVLWYFITRAYLHQDYKPNDTFQIYEMSMRTGSFVDAFSGHNINNSCSFVALSTVMMFYERVGVADMVPNDINIDAFNVKYDYKVFFESEFASNYFKDYLDFEPNDDFVFGYKGYLTDIKNKNLLKSEFLHQKLILNTFPNATKIVNGDTNNGFPYPVTKLGSVYNKFANEFGFKEYNYTTRVGTSFLPENIVKGNPCILGLDNNYPEADSKDSGHAVVCHAFEGTHPWWYTVDTVICDYGWGCKQSTYDINYVAVVVNANCVSSNSNFNVF